MKKLTSRERGFVVATTAAAFLLFNYLVVWDLAVSAIEQQRRLSAGRSEILLQKEVIDHTGRWEQEIKQLKSASGSAEKTDAGTDWLRRLEATAKRSGLSVNSQRPIPEKKTAFGTEAGVNYSMEASQEGLVKFLYALRGDPANPQVQSLQIAPDTANSEKLRVEATILVTRYAL